MHQSIEEKLNRKADFKVKYRFYPEEEGGRKTGVYQGYRSDFWYPHEGGNEKSIYMISPEFEDGNGNLILDTNKEVNKSGKARMWIVNQETYKKYHQERIEIGTRGFFMEGSKRVAECEVIELIGLLDL